MYIYAPDIFLVSILNECSISITVLMCHREMYIYAPDNFLNEWMNELISERSMKNKKPMNIQWKEEQWKNCILNEICISIMKFYHRKYMLTKNKRVSEPRTFSYPGSCATNTPTSLFLQCNLIPKHWNNLNQRVETCFKGGLMLMTS